MSCVTVSVSEFSVGTNSTSGRKIKQELKQKIPCPEQRNKKRQVEMCTKKQVSKSRKKQMADHASNM